MPLFQGMARRFHPTMPENQSLTRHFIPTEPLFQPPTRLFHPMKTEFQSQTRQFDPTKPDFQALAGRISTTFGLREALLIHIFPVMSDGTSSTSAGAGASAGLDPVAFFAALGSEVRWAIFALLADGTPRTSTQVAAVLQRDFDGVSKHMRLMREAGVLSAVNSSDRRFVFFTVASEKRREPGVVDYGLCVIRLSGTKWALAKD